MHCVLRSGHANTKSLPQDFRRRKFTWMQDCPPSQTLLCVIVMSMLRNQVTTYCNRLYEMLHTCCNESVTDVKLSWHTTKLAIFTGYICVYGYNALS